MMFYKYVASVAAVVAVVMATSPSVAGEARFSSTWTADSKADLVKMLRLHHWDDAVIDKTLDRFAYYLGVGSAPAGQEMVVDGIQGAAIGVTLDPAPIRGMPGCEIGSMSIKNPLRSRTSVTGVFCRHGSSWTYDAGFLEISEVDINNRTLMTTDVTDIGKKRPK